MAFVCPRCATATLEIQRSIDLPGDAWWDEIAFQLAVCRTCDLHAACLYQESRRGNLQDEAWQHQGIRIESERYRQLEQMFLLCPSPNNRHCRCTVHQTTDWENLFPANSSTFHLVRKPS